jgi:hypothetical protein
MLLQEAEILTGIGSRRLALPLSAVRWEAEGGGSAAPGVITKDGKTYVETERGKRSGSTGDQSVSSSSSAPASTSAIGNRQLTSAQAALRKTALTTVVQQIQSLEVALREVNGKSQDEWDGWLGKMMNDLVRENGTSWGECLEVGAWWATKRS